MISILEKAGGQAGRPFPRDDRPEKVQPFVIVGLGADFVEGKFTSPIRDAPGVIRRINQICKPDSPSPDTEEKQIANLLQTQRFFLWWD